MAKKQTNYRRGGKKHYADMARKSVDSRIKRHITVEALRDERQVTTFPTRKRESDAGYDITTPKAIVLRPGASATVPLGLRVCCPRGYFYEIRGRSSLNSQGIEVMDNVIDATYTGELMLTMTNRGESLARFEVGERVAQLIFLPQIHVKFVPVKAFTPDKDARGGAGFGSSGRK